MKRALLLFLLLLIALLGSVLAHLNAELVSFNYYFSTLSLPLALLLFFVLAAGVLCGVLLSLGMVLHARRERAQLRRRLTMCEQEIKNLRDIPIKGQF
jgi:putative membrane protein